jgi:hypothetical protein
VPTDIQSGVTIFHTTAPHVAVPDAAGEQVEAAATASRQEV